MFFAAFCLTKMEYEHKPRVTKQDKKSKKEVYSSKHIRNAVKLKETALAKKGDKRVVLLVR